MSVETEKPQQKRNIFAKEWTKWAALCAAVLAICMLFLPLIEQKIAKGDDPSLVYLWDLFKVQSLMVNLIVVLVLLVGSIPLILFSSKKSSLAVGATMALMIAGALMVVIPSIYLGETGYKSADINAGLVFGFAFAVLSAAFSLAFSYKKMPISIRDMAEDAVLVAASFALNFVKIPVGASGGSINFQMLPLFIIALRHGPLQGLISGGIVFGVLTCFTDGYGFTTFPFDYLIGFGSVAVLGFLKNKILGEDQKGYNVKGIIYLVCGAVAATAVRLIGSSVSSMVFYDYSVGAALAYNIPYILPSGAIALAVLLALYGPLLKLNKRFPVSEKTDN